MRDGRLCHAQPICDFLDAGFLLKQCKEDADTGGVAEYLEEVCHALQGRVIGCKNIRHMGAPSFLFHSEKMGDTLMIRNFFGFVNPCFVTKSTICLKQGCLSQKFVLKFSDCIQIV